MPEEINTSVPQGGEPTTNTQGENTNQTPQQTPETQVQAKQTNDVDYTPFLNAIGEKAKFNHEPAKPESIDDVITNYQKGLNYDNVMQRYTELQNNPALSFVENLAKQNGMTTEQYIEAANKEMEQERLNQLIQQNIPPELAQEIMANRQFRQQYEEKQKDIEAQERRNADYQAFLNAYPDVKPETIPAEVWDATNKGVPLVDAYTRYENQQLKAQVAKFNQSQQTQENNKKNAETSTGSVQGQGAVPNGYISKEEFDKNKGNQAWLNKNYDVLKKSMNKWGNA